MARRVSPLYEKPSEIEKTYATSFQADPAEPANRGPTPARLGDDHVGGEGAVARLEEHGPAGRAPGRQRADRGVRYPLRRQDLYNTGGDDPVPARPHHV